MLDALTTDSAEWYETLPFVVGSVFVGIELIVLIAKGGSLHYYAPRLGYMLSEGIAVCIMPMYGVALAFNRSLALAIAEKNSKVLAVAMLVAFATLNHSYFRGLVFEPFSLRDRRVGKGALVPCPPFPDAAFNGGHAHGRIRVQGLCPPYEDLI
jgi:hypothetical protein